ncbi:MAG: hypothetical protein ACUVQ8_08620 [Nitrososphaeria archaeon]
MSNTSRRFTLYQDIDGTTYDIELPLTSYVNPLELRDKLCLPSYIDVNYYPMEWGIVALYAAINAPRLHELYPNVFEKRVSKELIPALFFGGAAVKIHCQSANGTGPLARGIKDTDFIVPKKQGMDFYRLLLNLDKLFGTKYKSFATKNDKRFNAWRYGERYRLTTINGITASGTPTITVLDLFCDNIDLRHKIQIKEAFEEFKDNLYTIGLEHLVLTKAQLITDLPKEKVNEFKEHGQDYRILSYPFYASDKMIIGMEEKDVKDVCAIFLDHPIGEGAEEVNARKMRRMLDKDKKFALTVTLNLKNIVEKEDVLKKWLSSGQTEVIVDRIQALLKELPYVDKKWDKPWWNTAVETPILG